MGSNPKVLFGYSLRPGADQLRKPAVVTKGVGLFAEVPHHLQQALLHGRFARQLVRGGGEQAFACELQHDIVLAGRPGKKAMLDLFLHGKVFTLRGASPEPWQNRIHRQVRQPRRTEERLRGFQPA
jgi:hypothetical protein